ncbi:hemin receptor [Hymenobacter fastidiosus]|uniref:Hemin receptor n=1 Tax=Hymenobacter fastidiosus TaxID=486264 RepID=A0ABP7SV99_9BACT
MKNVKYWLGLALTGWASHAFAQNETDALRYSRIQFGGPARTLGIAGANVALGADLGNLSSNPAGLGLFRKSEFSFTPGLGLGQFDSRPLSSDNTLTDNSNSFHIGSLGAVFTGRLADEDNSSDWRAANFGVGLTRINDFNVRYHYNNTVDNNRSLLARLGNPSIIDNSLEATYTDIDEQYDNEDYYSLDGLAYGAGLTGYYEDQRGNDSLGAVRRIGPILQNEVVLSTGSQTQFDLAFGTSYRDKLYLGAALGIVSTRYNETRTFQEREANDPTNATAFTSLTRRDQVETRGSGVNLRVGAIYRLHDAVRLGATIQTPTFMRLTDNYSTSFDTQFSRAPRTNFGTSGSVRSLPSDYTYSLTTPFRASGGAAVTIGKYGFLTGDVEYVNYSQARLGGDKETNNNDTFDAENNASKTLYGSAVNLRFGGEARLDIFRLRAGYARYGDPYKANEFDRTRQFFTAGVGLRQGKFFLDAASVYALEKRYDQSYSLADQAAPVINVNGNRYTTSVTIGTTF